MQLAVLPFHAPAEGAGGENTLAAQGAPRPAEIESALAGQVQDLIAAGQRPRGPRRVRANRRAPATPRVAHRVALSARRGRGRRSGTGCVRQGVHAHPVVSAESVVRGLADANPDQRLSRSAEGADAPIALDAAGRRRRPPRSGRHRARDAAEPIDRPRRS